MFYQDPNPAGKPAALQLHGFGMESTTWGFQISALLSDGVRPIIPDIPGFGKSLYCVERLVLVNTFANGFLIGITGRPDPPVT